MLTSAYLALVRQMPVVSIEQLTGGSPFLVLSPHPDDETLGTGGLIAEACARHQTAGVVVATDGSGSHPHSRLYPRQKLIETRRAELDKASRILGVAPGHTYHLGLRDTAAPSTGADFDAAVARILEIARTMSATSLFVTWECDPHCDHQAAAAIAKAVKAQNSTLRLWAYPIWGWHLDPASQIRQPPPDGCRLDITARLSSKRDAIAAHASQMTNLISDDPEGFSFTEATLAPFIGPFEYFIEVPE